MLCSICFALLNAVAFVILMFHFMDKQWRSDYLEYNHFAACDRKLDLPRVLFASITSCNKFAFFLNSFSF